MGVTQKLQNRKDPMFGFLTVLFLCWHRGIAEECCPVKVVSGSDDLVGTYKLAIPGAGETFPDLCM